MGPPPGTVPHARGRSSIARGAGAQVRSSQARRWGTDPPGVSPLQKRSVVEKSPTFLWWEAL